jgi:ribonuclease D
MSEEQLKEVPLPTVITAREHLEEVVADLAGIDRLAIDTESNGFYAYHEKVCLIQLSSPTHDYIVDPIAIKDISCLGPMLADPKIEKLFHAGEYDVLCLKRDYGFEFSNLFDTMIASRMLGFKELGLAAAIERHFGVKLSKKLQRADWGLRPLTDAQIRYAQMDTHFLMRLADIQKKLLVEKNRQEDAAEAFAELAQLRPTPRAIDPDAFWRVSGRDKLGGQQLACLREVFLFRESQAQSRDRAPFRVMPEDLLLRLATSMPATMEELGAVRGMTPFLLQRFGRQLLSAIERGKSSPPPPEPPRPPRERRDTREWKLYEELRQWRKAQADKEGLDPVCIVSGDALREIARAAFARESDVLKVLSEGKKKRYGESLTKMLSTRGYGS